MTTDILFASGMALLLSFAVLINYLEWRSEKRKRAGRKVMARLAEVHGDRK